MEKKRIFLLIMEENLDIPQIENQQELSPFDFSNQYQKTICICYTQARRGNSKSSKNVGLVSNNAHNNQDNNIGAHQSDRSNAIENDINMQDGQEIEEEIDEQMQIDNNGDEDSNGDDGDNGDENRNGDDGENGNNEDNSYVTKREFRKEIKRIATSINRINTSINRINNSINDMNETIRQYFQNHN